MKKRSEAFILNATLFSLSLFLMVHFFFIFLHAGPLNPVSVSLKSVTDNYVGRFFQQNWHLFAPQPMTQNLKLYVRVKYKGEGSTKTVISNWYDVTEPMIRTNETTVFSPYNRMLRIGSGYIHQLYIGGKDDLTYKLMEKISKKDNVAKEINAFLEKDSDQVEQIIYRYASAFAKREFLKHEITDVQFMTSISDAIPYSKRDDLHFKVKEDNVVYGWKGVVKDVVELP
ncbi:DUF5819 family protein [Paenibacillus peoriae]|uniref:DUF5819 family protein n=1 Tax=Paenibacillus peoriae TaxID=59893 RepID=UPI0030CF589B